MTKKENTGGTVREYKCDYPGCDKAFSKSSKSKTATASTMTYWILFASNEPEPVSQSGEPAPRSTLLWPAYRRTAPLMLDRGRLVGTQADVLKVTCGLGGSPDWHEGSPMFISPPPIQQARLRHLA